MLFERMGHGLTAAMLVLTLFLPGSPSAADGPSEPSLEKLTIAYSSTSGTMAPLWITFDRGLFRKYRLDVHLVYIESGSTTAQSLINKEVAFAQMAGAGVLQSRLRGSDLTIIAGFLNTMDYQLMVDKDIARPDQLKGKTLAVSRFGSSSDFATRYALERFGLVPERDVTILEIGSQPARFAALQTGKIQAAMVAVPVTAEAKALGFHTLADLQMLGLEYQHTGLATTRELIRSRPDLVRNVLKAYVEGIHYYKTHRDESLAILAKYMRISNPSLLNELYDNLGLMLTPQKPYPTIRGIEIMLRELAAKNPKAKNLTAEAVVDLSFVKELDQSGFIDRLYAAQPALAAERDRPVTTTAVKSASAAEPVKNTAAPISAPPSSTAFAAPGEYIVQPGDTLSHIALQYYGDRREWEKIYQANKPTMKNPDYIYVGQKLMIPS